MHDHLDPATVEAIARAGFVAAAANAAREIGLDKPVTWDEHLTDGDREHELVRTRATLSAAYPPIAAKAWEEGYAEGSRGRMWDSINPYQTHTDRLEAVLELHYPTCAKHSDEWPCDKHHPSCAAYCETCFMDAPCPTVAAITAAAEADDRAARETGGLL